MMTPGEMIWAVVATLSPTVVLIGGLVLAFLLVLGLLWGRR